MKPTVTTIKRLCALSDNRCAFEGCPTALVDDESGTVTGEICHIKSQRKGGPRYDPTQTEKDRQDFSNLIMLCATHHKVVDADVEKFTVTHLQTMKKRHNSMGRIEAEPIDATRAQLLLQSYTVSLRGPVTIGTIHAEKVTISGKRNTRPKIEPPPDVVAGSSAHRRYAHHLIKRYQEFASQQPGRNFGHGAVYKAIEREFGAPWDWVPLSQFTELSAFIQGKIDGTQLGRINRSKGFRNYSSFEQSENKINGKA